MSQELFTTAYSVLEIGDSAFVEMTASQINTKDRKHANSWWKYYSNNGANKIIYRDSSNW
ncbi:MAG: hypothetical protein ACRC42_04185 [Mycoplasma sp.]